MIAPLIWKEWHEQRWKIAFGTVMLLSFAGSFMAARIASAREVTMVIWVLGGMVLALYSAMGVFAPETSGRTTTFLVSKPVAAWKVFVCKWFFGWLNVAVPMAACGLAFAIIAFGSGNIGDFGAREIVISVSGIMMATMFYTMTCCLAPRKSSEAFVGFVGILVFLAMAIHIMVIETTGLRAGYTEGFTVLQEVVVFVNPYSWVLLAEFFPSDSRLAVLIIVQAALFAVVMWIGLRKWRRSY